MCEGDEITLVPTCGAFITMNPGYLGRSELPEGLKALFRPMTVMTPDLVLICENMLMAEGFNEAKSLASKFFGLYSLLSQLLSKQEHYDWGLRAVKSVLVVAGGMKRAEPELLEDAILMRALRDFNTPKIVKQDEVVFFGLLGDLFPGIDPPRNIDATLEGAVSEACRAGCLHPDEIFRLKVVQLEELVAIRHCVFTMGPPAAGKSACWRTLQRARAVMDAAHPTKTVDVNPKAVPTEELYGYLTLATREWRDGLLSSIMRDLGAEADADPKWIILDGDLDANWIESMNSVMDDNRMLTLASNERIPLKSNMRMIFEIRDLKYATPATVSRAGILYISAEDNGPQAKSLIATWLAQREGAAGDAEAMQRNGFVKGLFDEYVPDALRFLRSQAKPIVPVGEITAVAMLLNLLSLLMPAGGNKGGEKGGEKGDADANAAGSIPAASPEALETQFVFAAVWAFGMSLTVADDGTDYRKAFSDWWRGAFKKVKFPTRDTVLDYWLNPADGKFDTWQASPQFSEVPFDSRAGAMSEVTVPTRETAAVAFWVAQLIDGGVRTPVMLCGAAGTGKTQMVKGVLRAAQEAASGGGGGGPVLFTAVNFSFYTTSRALQQTLEGVLVKRTGSRYGPKGAGARMIYFVDDMNLPEVDPYNTQSAIALLRQHVDYGHWYDRARLTSKAVEDCQYVAAMNPTAGSFTINPRLQRHFATFAVGLPGSTSLMQIYSTFLNGHLAHFAGGLAGAVGSVGIKLIQGALGVQADATKAFRKTVANFHYEFNIRHLSAVFQGLLASEPAQFAGEDGAEKFAQLWLHETERVYGDRLVSAADVAKFKGLLVAQAKKHFSQFNFAKFFANDRPAPLVFCHFAKSIGDMVYDRAEAIEPLKELIQGALKEYNEMNAAMDLVLFDDAVKHIARIVRIVMGTSGHAMLVGVGGSGKQSLSRLAAFIGGLTVRQIAISSTYGLNDFKGDLQGMYTAAGMRGDPTMFLFTDGQITDERVLVYLNDLLASGDIPDLYTSDEKDAIISDGTPKAKAAQQAAGQAVDLSPGAVWGWYMQQIRANLHCCLCFSPVGEDFRTRARKFPALINCTSIDWFQPWPADALAIVAQKFMAPLDFDTLVASAAEEEEEAAAGGEGEEAGAYGAEGGGGGGGPAAAANDGPALSGALVRGGVESFMPYSFGSVNGAAEAFYGAERRRVFSTPKTYLELLRLYARLLGQKSAEAGDGIDRLDGGLAKLKETGEAVAKLEAALSVMLEEAEAKKENAEGIARIASQEQAVVQAATAEANEEADKCHHIAMDVTDKQASTMADLAKAEPAVQAAVAALNTLNVKDLQSCKTMSTPPAGVDDVFGAVMNLLAGTPTSTGAHITVAKSGKVKDRSWGAAKKSLLGDVKGFIADLMAFKGMIESDAVPIMNFREAREYLALEHFTVEVISGKNSAAGGLCAFVINIIMFYDIFVTVGPKRKALAEANEQLEAANATLAVVTAHVAELQAKLDEVTAQLNGAEAEKQAAVSAVAKGKLKLNLAQRLTTALGDENVRWAANVAAMRRQRALLVGDVLLAAAFVTYAGPFTKGYRDALLVDAWAPHLRAARVPMSGAPDPLAMLASGAAVARWHTEGLPSDRVSDENGTVVAASDRWPLLIDPQLQGSAWLRENQGTLERHLHVVRLGQADILAHVEAALEAGHSVLIENMGEKIDAILWPVVSRATTLRGRKRYVKMGDKDVEFHPDFRLFLHTKLSNPTYPPEVQAECTLVNFTITRAGLEEQLLHATVAKERPDLARQSVTLVQQQNAYKIHALALEEGILQSLAHAEGDVTENVELIEGLEQSKSVSADIAAKSALAADTQRAIALTAECYRPVAARGALLFFVMNGLHKVHSFYMYSLNAFAVIFARGIDVVTEQHGAGQGVSRFKRAVKAVIATARFHWNVDVLKASRMPAEGVDHDLASLLSADVSLKPPSGNGGGGGGGGGAAGAMAAFGGKKPGGGGGGGGPPVKVLEGEDLAARTEVVTKSITATCFSYLRRGCFERDKLTIAALIMLQVLVAGGAAPAGEVRILVRGGAPLDASEAGGMGELDAWLPEVAWRKLKSAELDGGAARLKGLGDAMGVDLEEWHDWFDLPEPEAAPMPSPELTAGFTALQRLLVLRALRPDRVTCALAAFVQASLGPDYVAQPPFDMGAAFDESSASTPMLFVLFPGVDPTASIEALAATKGVSEAKGTFRNISMGQGQEEVAGATLAAFAKAGGWVLLQNVHLMQEWLPKLERTLEVVSNSAHRNFRCFISAEPPPLPYMRNIPESLLQSCIKVANEAPADLQSNLRAAWARFDQERIDACSKPGEFACCLFALCFFHSLVLGRRRFGQQGWSRAYSFNVGDLKICANVLHNYLDANKHVPWADLRYIFGEIMYGGHITDAWDRRTNNAFLAGLVVPELLGGLELAPGFRAPKLKHGLDYGSYAAYIDTQLPPESPVLFGMHPNAEIGVLTEQAAAVFGTMATLGAGQEGAAAGGGGGKKAAKQRAVDPMAAVRDRVTILMGRTPASFEIAELVASSADLIEGPQQPFVVVALQEARRMNVLLAEIGRTLADLEKGMNGQLNMTAAMEDLAQALSIDQVPGRNPFHAISWEKLAWPSKKGLMPWFADLQVILLASDASVFH